MTELKMLVKQVGAETSGTYTCIYKWDCDNLACILRSLGDLSDILRIVLFTLHGEYSLFLIPMAIMFIYLDIW